MIYIYVFYTWIVYTAYNYVVVLEHKLSEDSLIINTVVFSLM